MRFTTKSIHAGVKKDSTFNSVITPIYPSSTFRFDKIGENRGYDYTRTGNPTRTALAENLNSLEGGQGAFCTSTGMAAVTAVLHLLKAGDHVITGHDIYGGTYRTMSEVFSNFDIHFQFIDMSRPENIANAVRKNTKMIWIETPSNPLLNLVDIQAASDIAKKNNILSVVDNTFLSPYFQKPISFGIDIVVHSTTKYINGHSDVVGGAVVCADAEMAERVGFMVNTLGVGESPFDSWLVLRGVKTLSLRMERHQENATRIAEFLNAHPHVKKTYYPGLESHPQYKLGRQQMSGFGGMVSFDLDSSKVNTETFFAKLKLFSLAESLGGVESLVESPWYMSHVSMSEQARTTAGISPSNIRLSIGLEDVEDLIEDLSEAL